MIRLSAADIEARAASNRASWPQSTKTEPTPYVVKAKPVKATKKATCPTEHAEQCTVIKWCDTQPLARFIFAIPNGANKSMAGAANFKREGLRKGVPDLMLPIARNGFHGLFIEMKRTKGSVTSQEQRVWLHFLHKAGYAAFVCRGADEAIEVIKEYFK